MKKSSKAIIGTLGALAVVGTAIEVKRINDKVKELDEIDANTISYYGKSTLERKEYDIANAINNTKSPGFFNICDCDFKDWIKLKKLEISTAALGILLKVLPKPKDYEPENSCNCYYGTMKNVKTHGKVSEKSDDNMFSKLYSDDIYEKIREEHRESKQKMNEAIEKANDVIEKDDIISHIKIDDSNVPEIDLEDEDDTDLSEFEDREYNK